MTDYGVISHLFAWISSTSSLPELNGLFVGAPQAGGHVNEQDGEEKDGEKGEDRRKRRRGGGSSSVKFKVIYLRGPFITRQTRRSLKRQSKEVEKDPITSN